MQSLSSAQKPVNKLLLLAAAFLFSTSISAHNKVVVIPMAGDDATLEPFAPLTKNSPPDSDYMIRGSTVVDKITGLEWQRSDDSIDRDWVEAWDYCTNLPLDFKTDWRLPSVEELHSIVSYSSNPDNINAVAFPLASSNYWSASGDASNSSNAWIVSFDDGLNSVIINSKTFDRRVRCVRQSEF